MEQMAIAIFFVGLLVFLAHAFAALFQRARIPDVLSLVILGLILGPLTGLVTREAFGLVGGVFTTVALIVILFESGLGLDVETVRTAMGGTLRLTVASFVVNVVTVTLLARYLLGLPFTVGLLLGSIVGGTSSGIVIPMIRTLRLQPVSRTILLLESTFTDVLCIVFTLGLLDTFKFEEVQVGRMAGQLIASFLLAGLIGVAGAVTWSALLTRVRALENSMFTTPAFVFVLFGVAEFLGYSGAITALGFGVTMGNVPQVRKWSRRLIRETGSVELNQTERAFFAELVFLIKTFFFVYIGLSIELRNWVVDVVGLTITVAAFLLRIPTVRLTIQRSLPRFDAAMMAILIPRGLAAAALASLPAQQGIPDGELLQGVAYSVILFTVVICAALSFLFERKGPPQPYKLAFGSYAPTPREPAKD